MAGPGKVLQAERTSLVALNFQADPQAIRAWVPDGFEPDLHNGECYVSLVAVTLRGVRGRGLPIPICLGLGSVYLRVYVRQPEGAGKLRGFCQVRSCVTSGRGKWLLSPLFGDDLKLFKTRCIHSGFDGGATAENPPAVELSWRGASAIGEPSRIKVRGRHPMTLNRRDGKVSFIVDHHWLFAAQDGKTVAFEYHSAPATIWDAGHVTVQGNMAELVGERLAKFLGKKPASVFLIERTPISVTGPYPVEVATAMQPAAIA